MKNSIKAKLSILTLGLLVIIIAVLLFAPAVVEKSKNKVVTHNPYSISMRAEKLHQSLSIGDLHADSLLWDRDLLQKSNYGHVDIPRMVEGNVAVQIFTTVTKSPSGLNIEKNSGDSQDNITLLALLQTWPIATWNSLTARAIYQAQRLKAFSKESPQKLQIILNSNNLASLLQQRANGKSIVGGVLGIEGLHALDGHLENIDKLYDEGFRVMGLLHFFDNDLGGSLHGESKQGLTEFGKKVVARLEQKSIIIDVAHSSEEVVKDVLERVSHPIIVSHTGFHGFCPNSRNISDELMVKIATAGGLIGVGYWDKAACDITPKSIVKSIRYGIDLVGVDHIALGSDYDGTTTVAFDVSEIAVLTEEMLKANFSESEIRKVMGENMMEFLSKNLPKLN